jgi:hypothetical protein
MTYRTVVEGWLPVSSDQIWVLSYHTLHSSYGTEYSKEQQPSQP